MGLRGMFGFNNGYGEGSGFKGSPAEELVRTLEKNVKEKSNMLLAQDIKLQRANGSDTQEVIDVLKTQRERINRDLENSIDELQQVSPNNRFQRFITKMDKFDEERRGKRGLQVA